jgi:hypothetical protein
VLSPRRTVDDTAAIQGRAGRSSVVMPMTSFMAAGWMLLGVDSNEHGDPCEEMPCRFDDVAITGRDGIESAGVNRMLPSRLPPVAPTTSTD